MIKNEMKHKMIWISGTRTMPKFETYPEIGKKILSSSIRNISNGNIFVWKNLYSDITHYPSDIDNL